MPNPISSRRVDKQAAASGVTITVAFPDGRSATGSFDEVLTFDASTPNVALHDARLQAYVYHLLHQVTGYVPRSHPNA